MLILESELTIDTTPSVSCQPIHYRALQGERLVIVDGRYASTPVEGALPLEIFHPAFARFLGTVRDPDTPLSGELVRLCNTFMRNAAQIATAEKQRQPITRNMLRQLLAHGLTQTTQMDKSSADHIVLCSVGEGGPDPGVAALVIIEEKAELGYGGDPSVQGSFSFIEHLKEHLVRPLITTPV